MKELTSHITCFRDPKTGLNIYRIEGTEKTVLMDFGELPPEALDGVDLIILNQYLPDSLKALKPFLRQHPELTVAGTPTMLNFAKEFMEYDPPQIPIRTHTSFDLGDIHLEIATASNVSRARHQDRTWKRSYRFLQMPNWQWMDSLYCWCPEENAIFSGQFFSDEGDGEFEYFRTHQRPFPQEARRSLQTLCRAKMQQAFPAYGMPAAFEEGASRWKQYLNDLNHAQKTLLIPYASRFGLTELMAEQIAAGARQIGDITVSMVAVTEDNPDHVISLIESADAVIAGTPTIEEDAAPAMRQLFARLSKNACRGKLGAAFGNYSYTPKGTAPILTRMKQLEMRVIDTPFHLRFLADNDLVPLLEEFGAHVASCLVNDEVTAFRPDQKQAEPQTSSTDRRFLIIGSGAAGTTAAQEIRKLDDTCRIEILGDEPYGGYNRQILTRGILKDLSYDKLRLRPDRWYEAKNILTSFGIRAESIDPEKKAVTCSDGSTRTYDKLIYAAGARAAMPQYVGNDPMLPGVYPIHSLAEVQQMHEYIQQHEIRSILILGGGILGLETADVLHHSQVEQDYRITIADAAPHLMIRHTDEKAAALMEAQLEDLGISIMTNARLQALTGQDHVEAAVFEDGMEYPADLVILCMGIHENTEILQPEGGPLIVNGKMETNFRDIYACGDCAAYRGTNLGLWTQALEMSKVAAANAVGSSDTVKDYQPSAPAMSFTGLGLNLFAIGRIDQLDDNIQKTQTSFNPQTCEYQKLYFTENRFSGGILLGNADTAADLIELYQAANQISL